MKNNLKQRIISILLVILMLTALLPMSVLAEENDYPTAKVQKIDLTDINKTVPIYVPKKVSNWDDYEIGEVELGVLYSFSATETEEELEASPYKEWFCDYVVTFNKDVPKQSMGLYGSYGDYLDIGFLMPADIPANYEIYLLNELGLDTYGLKYKEVVTLVKEFKCGAFNLWEGNNDTTMKVALTIYQKNAEGKPINQHIVNQYSYKLNNALLNNTDDINHVTTSYGEFYYGGVGIEPKGEGWLLPGKYFIPQDKSGTYFTTKAYKDNKIEKPVITKEENCLVKDADKSQDTGTKIDEITNNDTFKNAAQAVVNDIKANTNITLTSSDIQEVITSETVTATEANGNVINKSAQLQINLESVEIKVETETQQEVVTLKSTTTQSALYDVKPIVTFVVNGVAQEPRKITNKELKDNDITINFKLPVPTTMTGNTVQIKHTIVDEKDSNNVTVETWTAKVEGTGENRYVSISAGAFSEYELSQITSTDAVAQITSGGVTYYYKQFESAVNDAKPGDTVVVLKNITGAAVTVDKAITIDANSCSITAPTEGTHVTLDTSVVGKYIFTPKVYTVNVTSGSTTSNATVAPVSGGGEIVFGTTATVTANEVGGYTFVGWYLNSYSQYATPLSTSLTYSFTVSEDISLVAVYSSVSGGAFELKVNGANYTVKVGNGTAQKQTGLSIKEYNQGTKITLNYAGNDGFMYWVNGSDNIVSTSTEYSLSVVCDTEIRAVTNGNKSDTESAYVVFFNVYNQILSASRWYSDEIVMIPSIIPGKMGYEFIGWEMQEIKDENGETIEQLDASSESIHDAMANNDVIRVVPKYTKVEGKYYVNTVIYDAQTGSITQCVPNDDFLTSHELEKDISGNIEVNTGEKLSISLVSMANWAELNKTDLQAQFSFWSVSYGLVPTSFEEITPSSFDNKQYTVLSGIDGKLINIILVINAPSVTETAVLEISQAFATVVQGEGYKLSTTLKYYVPDNWTVNEVGFIYGTKYSYFNENGESKLVMGGDYVTKHDSGITYNASLYTMNITAPQPNNTVYAKAYLTYTDDIGNIVTLFTPMSTISYNIFNTEQN